MSITIDNINVIEMVLTFPICGRWIATISLNTDDATNYSSGSNVTITDETNSYTGYISEFIGVFQNTTIFKVYGGKKDITQPIKAKSWNSSVSINDVITYILSASNFSISSKSITSVLQTRLNGWNIIAMDGDLALKNILNAVPDIIFWQVLPNGIEVLIDSPKYVKTTTYYNVQIEHPDLKQYKANMLDLGLQPGHIIDLQNGTTGIENIEYEVFNQDIIANIIGT